MFTHGGSRRRLEGILNAAFAEGLLSEQTHSYRLDMLFGRRLIDQQGLVGDLTLRSGRSGPGGGVRRAFSALFERARALTGRGGAAAAPLLLALDWAEGEELLVGRDPRCDLVVEDPSVSRRHARLTFRDGAWVIQDLASTNGTSVNGGRVIRAALHAGDVIALGGQPIQID